MTLEEYSALLSELEETGKDAKTVTTTLDRWHAQYILEALRVCSEQWLTAARATDDEDLQADYGNDLVRLHIIQEFLKREAVEVFGPGIKEFSREPLTAALSKP